MNAIQPLAVPALLALAASVLRPALAAEEPWVAYRGGSGPGAGKRVVLVTGDEEYRSEEAMTQLARILAHRHGFHCTVLFAINRETGEIDPVVTDNIPGLEQLREADLMVIFTRFRNLPDEQMQHIVDYLAAGRPVLGLRTATHAFRIPPDRLYHKYDFQYPGEDYREGFGRQILGETWIDHHGAHGKESTRGMIPPEAAGHPINRGIASGDIWGPTDVYTVRLPLPGDSTPLVLGEVLAGMGPSDAPVEGPKNKPPMPIAWVKTYQGTPGGPAGKVFATTMGASRDLQNEGLRRLLVNAVYWLLDLDVPARADVALVGDYAPLPFGFAGHKKGVKPADLRLP